jgi:hypothetical protein
MTPVNLLQLKKKHHCGITKDGRKFVYCPIGHIISWLADDYDNKWCAYCDEYL